MTEPGQAARDPRDPRAMLAETISAELSRAIAHGIAAGAHVGRKMPLNVILDAVDAYAAQEPKSAPVPVGGQWTVAELAAALDSFCAWFTATGGGARVQGQLLGADADEFARALHAGLESARAHRAEQGREG